MQHSNMHANKGTHTQHQSDDSTCIHFISNHHHGRTITNPQSSALESLSSPPPSSAVAAGHCFRKPQMVLAHLGVHAHGEALRTHDKKV
jgi:hypothetical protein